MMTFLDVMDMWPSDREMAGDLRAKISRVQKWRVRQKIPPQSWSEVIDAAKRRGFAVDAEVLLQANSPARSRKAPRLPTAANRTCR